MKQKQQVLSRFFSPKSKSPVSPSPQKTQDFPATKQAPTQVQWPPPGSRNGSHSPTNKSLPEDVLLPSSRKKRPLPPDFREDIDDSDQRLVTADVSKPEDDAISLDAKHEPIVIGDPVLCAEITESDNTAGSYAYKRRKKKQTTTEDESSLSFDGEEANPASAEKSPEPLAPKITFPDSKATRNCNPTPSIEIPASDPSLHKKFVETLLVSTESDPFQASRPAKHLSKEQYTPLEQQVVELKAKYTDMLLMIEVGYRFRMFGEDAEIAARVLGIFAYNDRNFTTASIPTFRLHVHVRRLVEAGYKVGVIRQTETAAIKAHGGNKVGPFTRSLSALYTRATLEAAPNLGGEECATESSPSNYLMCIAEQTDILKSCSRLGGNLKVQGDSQGESSSAYDTNIGLIVVEIATGDVMYGQLKDTPTRTELEAHLLMCTPSELLLASPLSSSTEKLIMDFVGPSSNVRIERVPKSSVGDGAALSEVLDFYGSTKNDLGNSNPEDRIDEGLEAILSMPELVIQALALALRFLKQFGLERVLRLGATFRPLASSSEMNLSSNTLQQLEILRNNADGSAKGSLLWLMNHTHTAFGARLFRHWVIHPLRDQTLIVARLDAVSEILESMGTIGMSQTESSFPGSGRGVGAYGASSRGAHESVGSIGAVLIMLKKSPDIERGITRIFHGTATASEFVSVLQAIVAAVKHVQRIYPLGDENVEAIQSDMQKFTKFRSPLLRRLLAAASSSVVSEHAYRLLSFLNTEAATTGDKHNLFICGSGKFPRVENCKAAVVAAEGQLDSFLPQYRKLLKMPNLQYLSVSGNTHLIEVPAGQCVPRDWVKVCSTKKTNRYHSPEILQALDALALAKEELTAECNKAWSCFLSQFASYYVDFRATVQAFASLDCLYSLAVVSRNQDYIRPNFAADGPAQLIIEDGRHPVLEATLQEDFVPNDTYLHADSERCQVITGPNMGGKSCYIRQVALIAVMAQVGSYVPARSAKLHVLDAIYTRMGASDNIYRGASTFLEELSEASTILERATPYSLVIMDELGRGTSTHDGVAIAFATLEYLLKDVKCLTLFVTHYPKIAELQEKYPNHIGAYHVSYLADQQSISEEASEVTSKKAYDKDKQPGDCIAAQKITFLYKLVQGVASRSFGIHVARLAQIPETCIHRASIMAEKFEDEVKSRASVMRRMDGTDLQTKIQEKLETQELHLPTDGTNFNIEEVSELIHSVCNALRSSNVSYSVLKMFQNLIKSTLKA